MGFLSPEHVRFILSQLFDIVTVLLHRCEIYMYLEIEQLQG